VRSSLGREQGRAVEYIEIDGAIPDEAARALEQCILGHLNAHGGAPLDYLGEYEYNTRSGVGHSHPLAITQLLLVYHLLRAKQRDEEEV
jgi:phosphoribulokinase